VYLEELAASHDIIVC